MKSASASKRTHARRQVGSIVMLLTAVAGGCAHNCEQHPWSAVAGRSNEAWKEGDEARLGMLRAIMKAHEPGAVGNEYFDTRNMWRVSHDAAHALAHASTHPDAACSEALGRLRWHLDHHYYCGLGKIARLWLADYVDASPARRKKLLSQVAAMHYGCEPLDEFRAALDERLKDALRCTTDAPR